MRLQQCVRFARYARSLSIIVLSVTKNCKSAIYGGKIAQVRARTSKHNSLVRISVIVNKEGTRLFMVEKKRHWV